VVGKIEDCAGKFVVACSFICVTENFKWAFAGVYGPNDNVERCLLDKMFGIMSCGRCCGVFWGAGGF